MRPSTTGLALIGAALAVLTGTALAADISTPVVCGSNGCTPLATSTLQGLLTLPEALRPVEPPPAQQFLLFHVEDLDGARHEVVYVSRDGEALLGFAGKPRWRLVPADDARLLADAARGAEPYPAAGAGTPLGRLFAAHERSGWRTAGWIALAALLGVGVVGVVAYTTLTRASRRSA